VLGQGSFGAAREWGVGTKPDPSPSKASPWGVADILGGKVLAHLWLGFRRQNLVLGRQFRGSIGQRHDDRFQRARGGSGIVDCDYNSRKIFGLGGVFGAGSLGMLLAVAAAPGSRTGLACLALGAGCLGAVATGIVGTAMGVATLLGAVGGTKVATSV
jgi:hypothetical protein